MRQPSFQGVCSVSADTLRLNREYSTSLGLPLPMATAGKLAIVGGGASAFPSTSGLQHWDGEVWGINGAASWLRNNGIPAALFSISPCRDYPRPYLTNIRRAILSYECDPGLFDSLKGAELFAFDRDEHGPTSVCAAVPMALKMGFEEVHLFGCEGNYGLATHAYQDTPSAADIAVRIGGADYLTNIGYFVQTQMLAHLVSGAPDFCKDRSGGMLSALAADPEGWDVIKLPSELKEAA